VYVCVPVYLYTRTCVYMYVHLCIYVRAPLCPISSHPCPKGRCPLHVHAHHAKRAYAAFVHVLARAAGRLTPSSKGGLLSLVSSRRLQQAEERVQDAENMLAAFHTSVEVRARTHARVRMRFPCTHGSSHGSSEAAPEGVHASLILVVPFFYHLAFRLLCKASRTCMLGWRGTSPVQRERRAWV